MALKRIVYRSFILASTAALLTTPSSVFAAEEAASLADAVTGGKAYLNLRARYENVDQANLVENAKA